MGELNKQWDKYKDSMPKDMPDLVYRKFKQIYYMGAAVVLGEMDRSRQAITDEEKEAINAAINSDISQFLLEDLMPDLKQQAEGSNGKP